MLSGLSIGLAAVGAFLTVTFYAWLGLGFVSTVSCTLRSDHLWVVDRRFLGSSEDILGEPT